jgi:hypothetical protein
MRDLITGYYWYSSNTISVLYNKRILAGSCVGDSELMTQRAITHQQNYSNKQYVGVEHTKTVGAELCHTVGVTAVTGSQEAGVFLHLFGRLSVPTVLQLRYYPAKITGLGYVMIISACRNPWQRITVCFLLFLWSRGSSDSIVSNYGLDDRDSIPDRDRGFFFQPLRPHRLWGPTQPPIQWVPGVLSPGVKRGRGVTLTTHPHLEPRLSMSRSYTSSPPCASMAWSGTALLYFTFVYFYTHSLNGTR